MAGGVTSLPATSRRGLPPGASRTGRFRARKANRDWLRRSPGVGSRGGPPPAESHGHMATWPHGQWLPRPSPVPGRARQCHGARTRPGTGPAAQRRTPLPMSDSARECQLPPPAESHGHMAISRRSRNQRSRRETIAASRQGQGRDGHGRTASPPHRVTCSPSHLLRPTEHVTRRRKPLPENHLLTAPE
jgi:hypothetical protein